MKYRRKTRAARWAVLFVGGLAVCGYATAQVQDVSHPRSPDDGLIHGQYLPTGYAITPTAARGAAFHELNPGLADHPAYRVDHAASTAISPDGQTLLVLTSGYDRLDDAKGHRIDSASDEYVFVYDISQGMPRKTQVIKVANTFLGIAWNPKPKSGRPTFYVSGGVDDDIHAYTLRDGQYVASGAPIKLGHTRGNGLGKVRPMAAGLSVSPDGTRLLVANLENDSVSLIDLATRSVVAEQDLRPGIIDPARSGVPGGEYPVAVQFDGNDKAYVSSQRDRELDVLAIARDAPRLRVRARIPTRGQPNKMVLNRSGNRLYVASDNSDRVLVIDTATDHIVQSIPTVAPPHVFQNSGGFKGAGPNSVRLSPNGHWLFVTNGGMNSVAVIQLAGAGLGPTRRARPGDDTPDARPGNDPGTASYADATDAHDQQSRVIGLIPTGWYPESVNVSADGRHLYIANGKSAPGGNADHCGHKPNTHPSGSCHRSNEYVWQLEKAGLLSMPTPNPRALGRLTRQVAYNDHFMNQKDYGRERAVMRFLHRHIRHVIYVVKENRTYDQVLGDLPEGNGDPSLAFLAPYMPNHHRWARQFVDLDNFYDSGESSNMGWDWSTAARTNDYTEKTGPMNYAGRGFTYDQEGTNRNVNVGLATLAKRQQFNPAVPDKPNLLPGAVDVAALEGPGPDTDHDNGQGYIWNQALKAGLTLRNYGFFGDLSRYYVSPKNPAFVPLARHPHAAGVRQFFPTKPALMKYSDPYFRGFDNSYPDYWREQEWAREFSQYVAHDNLPNLIQVRLMRDHTGNFSSAIDGVNTVATQVADNDYAVARLVQRVAHSRYKDNTLVFIVEDDAQSGADHVSAHRSVAFVVGPYVKQGAVVSRRYTTVNMLRTIEDVLGFQPMGLNDELAAPMTAVFDIHQKRWTYHAVVPAVLRRTTLPLPKTAVPAAPSDAQPPSAEASILDHCFAQSRRSATYWATTMRDQDFKVQDQLNTASYNRELWRGFEGSKPRPDRDGDDMRGHRQRLLQAHWRRMARQCLSRHQNDDGQARMAPG